MDIRKRLYVLAVAIILVFMGGSVGYYLLFGGKHSLVDCVYMTVISLTSVGYGEIIEVTGNVPAQIFTMFIIIFGMGIILYGLSTMTAIIIEGELSGILRLNKMKKKIEKLRGHYIVCGGGETGFPLLVELAKNHETAVLIETEQEHIDKIDEAIKNLLYIKGNATEDEKLIDAGIERAAGILVGLPSDKDNLYITMTARMLNRNIRIISRMIDPKLEPKLRNAGADGVVSPNFIGAMRMASEMIRPTAVDFLDSMLRSKKGNLRIHQLTVSQNGGLADKTIGDSRIEPEFDMLVLGSKKVDEEEIRFNPPDSMKMDIGMILIIMGDADNIIKFKDKYS